MRIKGKIISWNDDKGFGFVASIVHGNQIFVHINDFQNLNRRPKKGDVISYVESMDKRGRTCAKSALLSRDLSFKRKKGISFSFFLIVLFSIFLVCSYFLGHIPSLILISYSILSLLTFLIYAKDKSAAKRDRWRTKENTLHLLAMFGGWPGAIIAQQKLHHKSKKQSFRFIFWLTVLVNIGFLAWLHTPEGVSALDDYLHTWEYIFNN